MLNIRGVHMQKVQTLFISIAEATFLLIMDTE